MESAQQHFSSIARTRTDCCHPTQMHCRFVESFDNYYAKPSYVTRQYYFTKTIVTKSEDNYTCPQVFFDAIVETGLYETVKYLATYEMTNHPKIQHVLECVTLSFMDFSDGVPIFPQPILIQAERPGTGDLDIENPPSASSSESYWSDGSDDVVSIFSDSDSNKENRQM